MEVCLATDDRAGGQDFDRATALCFALELQRAAAALQQGIDTARGGGRE
jgi:hypothetical protein